MINDVFNKVGEGLGKLMNLVPDPERVTIMSIENFGKDAQAIDKFSAMFNPEQWTQRFEFKYDAREEPGTNAPTHNFKSAGAGDLDLELLFDGTGASGMKEDVPKKIEALMKLVGYQGENHMPNKLQVIWGTFLFQGVLNELNITYLLFTPKGIPLRAKVQMKILRSTSVEHRVVTAQNESPDLTHSRLVKEQQRLDQLCNAIYDSPRFLLEVAKANNLTTFRTIQTGTTLNFPPIEK